MTRDFPSMTPSRLPPPSRRTLRRAYCGPRCSSVHVPQAVAAPRVSSPATAHVGRSPGATTVPLPPARFRGNVLALSEISSSTKVRQALREVGRGARAPQRLPRDHGVGPVEGISPPPSLAGPASSLNRALRRPSSPATRAAASSQSPRVRFRQLHLCLYRRSV